MIIMIIIIIIIIMIIIELYITQEAVKKNKKVFFLTWKRCFDNNTLVLYS